MSSPNTISQETQSLLKGQLAKLSSGLTQSIARLSPNGGRISSQGTDSVLGVVERIRSQLNEIQAGKQNVSDAASYLQATKGALSDLTSLLVEMREKAVQGSGSNISVADRKVLDAIYQQSATQFLAQIQEATYNSIQIFKSDKLDVQFGASVSDKIQANTKARYKDKYMELEGSLANITKKIEETRKEISQDSRQFRALISKENSQEAVEVIDSTMATLKGMEANVSASLERLSSASVQLEGMSINLSRAKNTIESADFVQESTGLFKKQALVQTTTTLLAQANQDSRKVLSLLSDGGQRTTMASNNGPTTVSVSDQAIELATRSLSVDVMEFSKPESPLEVKTLDAPETTPEAPIPETQDEDGFSFIVNAKL